MIFSSAWPNSLLSPVAVTCRQRESSRPCGKPLAVWTGWILRSLLRNLRRLLVRDAIRAMASALSWISCRLVLGCSLPAVGWKQCCAVSSVIMKKIKWRAKNLLMVPKLAVVPWMIFVIARRLVSARFWVRRSRSCSW